MTFRSRKLLDLARDQACVMCGRQDGTIVAAHSNLLEHGKGMGMKAHDGMAAWLCNKCHAELDQGSKMSADQRRDLILTAICRTYVQMWNQELIQVKKGN
jgi:hypothetical protein